MSALHSHASPEWYTPASIVDAAVQVMGAIDLDPASCEEANRVVRAARYFTAEDDGLTAPWSGDRIFLNPPGGLVKPFWERLVSYCCSLSRARVRRQAIWIGYSLEQLQTLQSGACGMSPLHFSICVPRRRIAFVENEARRRARQEAQRLAGKAPTERVSPTHANYILYIGDHTMRFRGYFGPLGVVRL